MPTSARALVKKKIDIPAFVDHIREVNKEAARIFNAPLGSGKSAKLYFRQELASVLDELEQTVKVLRVVTVSAPSAPPRMPTSDVAKLADPAATHQKDVKTVWDLDTTEAMINKGQLLTPVEFQNLMGWASRQAVWKAAEGHRVFYLTHKAERYFPAFYGDSRYDRKHLEAVTKVLGELPGGSKLQFFLTRKGSLGGDTPLQALAAGRVAKVKDVAAAFAEVPTPA
ncbi:hypothetical protein [Ottowia thiooxydans]|uniref:hypothetical protein n=1 Tax=Ottowia thiooxydans TaxID=219182 RepID=UPI0012EB65D0|nr:hypothetical protein [Ottowia thiooxydans]